MIADRRAAQVRGTQTLVDQMGWMLRRPGIVAHRSGLALAVWRAVSAGVLGASAACA